MYFLGIAVVIFVVVESVFFAVKSWKHAKELGISTETLKNTVISSALFTIAPAISILVTVVALAGALGMVLPWIRLSVIGNLAYETVAAESTLQVLGGSLAQEITDMRQFSAVAWVMTIGSVFPLILLPFVCKKLQSKIGNVVNKSEKSKKWADMMAAAAFIGIISAFIARAINGVSTGEGGVITDSAGFMSIAVLVSAMGFMLLLNLLCSKLKLKKLEPFAMPIAMFAAMGMSMILVAVLPESITSLTWYEIGGMLK